MSWYEERVLPRVIDLTLGSRPIGKVRQRSLADLKGTVVEIGFGSGTNLPYYPDAVDRVLAVEPSMGARRLARKRLSRARVPVEFVGLDGASLPFDDDSVDSVLSTWTLCTIPDIDRALAEVRRVLRPGAKLHFLEHGLSDDPKVARRQHRFDRFQQKVAGGCHLDRDHRALIEASGLHIGDLAKFTIAGPKMLSFMYAGTASKPT